MKRYVVAVRFEGTYGKEYHYLTSEGDLQRDDKVVVDSANGLGIAIVEGYANHSQKASRWVVQKIDFTAHQQRKEKEKKMNILKAKMEKKRKALEELHIFQILAKEDEDMAKLLEEYKAISKDFGEDVF